jgi:hypothetical protein
MDSGPQSSRFPVCCKGQPGAALAGVANAMRVVYEAENLIDAHLVKGRLENEGIAVYVRGEYLTGALGELPVMGLVAVCVADADVPAAEQLLLAWRTDLDSGAVPEWTAEPDPA